MSKFCNGTWKQLREVDSEKFVSKAHHAICVYEVKHIHVRFCKPAREMLRDVLDISTHRKVFEREDYPIRGAELNK